MHDALPAVGRLKFTVKLKEFSAIVIVMFCRLLFHYPQSFKHERNEQIQPASKLGAIS
jgi:hypothetical protein